MAAFGIGTGVKAISLWQPWASAIPLGLKKIETRGWSTKYRGPLVIHAAKRWTAEQREFLRHCSQYNVFHAPLPFGQLIAVCDLLEVLPSEQLRLIVSQREMRYGVYDDGRFGWILGNIRPIVPQPFKGGQGFFNVPDSLVVPL